MGKETHKETYLDKILKVMVYLDRHGSSRICDITKGTGYSQVTVSRIIKKLRQNGIVWRWYGTDATTGKSIRLYEYSPMTYDSKVFKISKNVSLSEPMSTKYFNVTRYLHRGFVSCYGASIDDIAEHFCYDASTVSTIITRLLKEKLVCKKGEGYCAK